MERSIEGYKLQVTAIKSIASEPSVWSTDISGAGSRGPSEARTEIIAVTESPCNENQKKKTKKDKKIKNKT